MGLPSSFALSSGSPPAARTARGCARDVITTDATTSTATAKLRVRYTEIASLSPPVLSTLVHAMARLALAASGKTLRWGQGVARWQTAGLAYRLRRGALTALAVGALIAGLSATSVALQGVADDGVTPDATGT